MCPSLSQDGSLTKENIEWLETVFRDNVGQGQAEFTLEQFKKIVPSKNVSTNFSDLQSFFQSPHPHTSTLSRYTSWRGHFVCLTRTAAEACLWRSSWRPCISSPTKGRRRSSHFCSRCMTPTETGSLTSPSSGRSSSPASRRTGWSLMRPR